jgi:hypothetical protein
MTAKVVEELLHEIRKNIGSIYKLSDAIGLLDMTVSFTSYVTLSGTTGK